MALFLGLTRSEWASFSQLGKTAEGPLLKGDTKMAFGICDLARREQTGPWILNSGYLPNLMCGSYFCLLRPAHCSSFHLQTRAEPAPVSEN